MSSGTRPVSLFSQTGGGPTGRFGTRKDVFNMGAYRDASLRNEVIEP